MTDGSKSPHCVWFSENPDRSFRLVRVAKDEVPPECYSDTTHAVIRRLQSGDLIARFVKDENGGSDWDLMPDSDAVCAVLWDVLSTNPQDFSLDEIRMAARALENGVHLFRVYDKKNGYGLSIIDSNKAMRRERKTPR